jgi:hypothetical protein
MTNANLPERWLNDLRFRRDQLSDTAFRGYVNALMWSVANRTEGVIRPQDLKYLPDFGRAVIPELIGDDLWEPRGSDRGWLIVDFATTQTGKDLLEKYEREKAYDRKRKALARKAELAARLRALGESGGSSTGKVPPESPSTNQTKPGGGAEGDDDYADELREWYAEGERERLEELADRNVRDGYEQ